jgi:hypothetical protein
MCATCLADLVLISSPSCPIDSTYCGASCCLIFFPFSCYYSQQYPTQNRFSSDTPNLCACTLGWDSKSVNIANYCINPLTPNDL